MPFDVDQPVSVFCYRPLEAAPAALVAHLASAMRLQGNVAHNPPVPRPAPLAQVLPGTQD